MRTEVSRYLLVRDSNQTIFEILLDILLTCDFHDKVSSIVIPKKSNSDTFSIME